MTRYRRGFTMLEIMIVCAILAIISVMALPKFTKLKTGNNLRSSKQQLAAAIATARAAAVQKGRGAQFHVNGSTMWVTADTSSKASVTKQTVIPQQSLTQRFAVTMTMRTPASDSLLIYDSRGFLTPALSTSAMYILSAQGRADTVCVSRLGIIMKSGCSLQ